MSTINFNGLSTGAKLLRLGVMLLPILAAGCGFQQAKFTQTTESTFHHEAGSGVKVSACNGSISVRRAPDSSSVVVTATLRMVTQERLGETSIVANRNSSGVFEIFAKPPADGWRGNEGCSFDIMLPEANGVDLETSNGKITMSGLAGTAKLDTSNGAIAIADHAGDIEATSSNGRIEAEQVAGVFKAHTSNGSVNVRLADNAAGPVEIDTSNGPVTLELSSVFRGELSVDTSNGSIHLPQSLPKGMNIQTRNSGRHATMRVGEGGPKSTIDTSNGGVTVRFVN